MLLTTGRSSQGKATLAKVRDFTRVDHLREKLLDSREERREEVELVD